MKYFDIKLVVNLKIILSVFLLILGACNRRPPLEEERGTVLSLEAYGEAHKPYDHREQIIEVINGLIDTISSFSTEDINNKFHSLKSGEGTPKLSFFAEKHHNLKVIGDNFAAINLLGSSTSLLLLEGLHRKRQPQACEEVLYLYYYHIWAWRQKGKKFNVTKRNAWIDQEKISEYYAEAMPYLRTEAIPLSKMHCAYWDDRFLVQQILKKHTADLMRERNISMLKAINEWQKFYPEIFVIAGTWHLPMGDAWLSTTMDEAAIDYPLVFPHYYLALKGQNVEFPFSINKRVNTGTTEPIYGYLGQEKIPYLQFLHKRLLSR